RKGRFSEALNRLGRTVGSHDLDSEVLRVHLLERTGSHTESRMRCERILKNRSLSPEGRSRCEISLGLMDWDAGFTDSSVTHFQRAVSFAGEAKNLEITCWAQLRLLRALAMGAQAQAVTALLAELRHNSLRLGDSTVAAAIHIILAELEGRRSLVENVRRHTLLGQRLLLETPNCWLECVAENNLVGVSLMSSDFHDGLKHAETAVHLSNESGAMHMQRACLTNLGNLHWMLGDRELAVRYFGMARAILPSDGECSNASLDSLARLNLEQGRLDEASEL